MFFLCILVIFILSYGVASQALLYPNSEPSWSLLNDIIYKPYWQMYGELFLEELEGTNVLSLFLYRIFLIVVQLPDGLSILLRLLFIVSFYTISTGDVEGCTYNTTAEPDLNRCPKENRLVILLFALYMILTNVLLLNLLIAMFR